MAGLMAAVSIFVGEIATIVDSDTKTNPNVSLIVANIGILIALFNTRDNKVTSEQAKAKK